MSEHDSPAPPTERGPDQFTGLERSAPPKKVAGLKAVGVALQHMKREGYGPIEATRVLARMNQKDGFDCPGCAWPDPDDRRSAVAEYCENGAKAIAEEATKKRCGSEFFAAHTVEELGRLSDFCLLYTSPSPRDRQKSRMPSSA